MHNAQFTCASDLRDQLLEAPESPAHLTSLLTLLPTADDLVTRLKPKLIQDPLLDGKGQPFTHQRLFRCARGCICVYVCVCVCVRACMGRQLIMGVIYYLYIHGMTLLLLHMKCECACFYIKFVCDSPSLSLVRLCFPIYTASHWLLSQYYSLEKEIQGVQFQLRATEHYR